MWEKSIVAFENSSANNPVATIENNGLADGGCPSGGAECDAVAASGRLDEAGKTLGIAADAADDNRNIIRRKKLLTINNITALYLKR